jgi:hypothetical protein
MLVFFDHNYLFVSLFSFSIYAQFLLLLRSDLGKAVLNFINFLITFCA